MSGVVQTAGFAVGVVGKGEVVGGAGDEGVETGHEEGESNEEVED